MIDFAIWNELLHKYVDAQGRVDYCAWKADSYHLFNKWLVDIEHLNLQSLSSSDERLAVWINLYNAFTIASILKNYPIASIQPKILGIPNWITFAWFFYRPTHKVNQRYYSLNQIEHRILRREFNEPRIHFALVCASIGCPLLRNEAYQPESIYEQLEDDTIRFINNPDKVHYDSSNQILYCSKIFKWYESDFLKVATSIPDYICSHAKIDIPLDAKTPIIYLNYDWSLNQQKNLTICTTNNQ